MAFIKNGDPQPIMAIYKSSDVDEEFDEETQKKLDRLKISSSLSEEVPENQAN